MQIQEILIECLYFYANISITIFVIGVFIELLCDILRKSRDGEFSLFVSCIMWAYLGLIWLPYLFIESVPKLKEYIRKEKK